MFPEKPETAPLRQKLVDRLQDTDEWPQAQAVDDIDVPRYEAQHVSEHSRDADIRRKPGRIDRINDRLQCVVGARGAHGVGCGRGAELVSGEDRLVPVWWEVRREYRLPFNLERAPANYLAEASNTRLAK